jgi:hypothetical protein
MINSMKCPTCLNEMREGYLNMGVGLGGGNIFWSEDIPKGIHWKNPKGSVELMEISIKNKESSKEAHICETCRNVLLRY